MRLGGTREMGYTSTPVLLILWNGSSARKVQLGLSSHFILPSIKLLITEKIIDKKPESLS